jgi:hypothetical protein
MNGGFYKQYRYILGLLRSGDIDLLELGIYTCLCLGANTVIGSGYYLPAGIVSTSAPALREFCKRVSIRKLQRKLKRMEKKGLLKFSVWRRASQSGNFKVLICRAPVHDVSGKEFRVSCEKTLDWQHPVYEHVDEVAGYCRPYVGEVSGYRELEKEKEKEKKEKKNAAAKTAPPADQRRQPFLEAAYKAFADHFGQKPSWQGKDWKQLKILLAATGVPLEEMQARWRHYLASTEPFTVKKGGSLAYFCANFDAFINGPLLAPEKGTSHGKLTGDDLTRANLKAAGFDVN